MKLLSAGEWDIRVAGVYRDALNLTVYMDSNEARLDFGDGRTRPLAASPLDLFSAPPPTRLFIP